MEILKETLSSVVDWLKFAEAKNAVLITMSGFAIWALARLLLTVELPWWLYCYFLSLIAFVFAALLTSLFSFLPVLNYSLVIPSPNNVKNRNLFYFGYLATLSKNDLLKEFRSATGSPETDFSEVDGMYAEQIIINSRVALAKYYLFERSVNFVIIGALTPLLGILLLIFAKNRRNGIDGIG